MEEVQNADQPVSLKRENGTDSQSPSNAQETDAPPLKKQRLETRDVKGIAPIKEEFLLHSSADGDRSQRNVPDDDAAEPDPRGANYADNDDPRGRKQTKEERKKRSGQNKSRRFVTGRDEQQLCRSLLHLNEFDEKQSCLFGEKCKGMHDLRKYLEQRPTFLEATCYLFKAKGWCTGGWKCRWVRSHMEEVKHDDGKKELKLLVDEQKKTQYEMELHGGSDKVLYEVPGEFKKELNRRKYKFEKGEYAIKVITDSVIHDAEGEDTEEKAANRAAYFDTALKPSEKRRIHISASTPILAPLTTTGNLPFRRLCGSFGADITYSEMAMSVSLIKGENVEWARVRAHPSEKHFGVQIEASKPWQAVKATECLANTCPSLHVIDLNCGCPVDMVYRSGGGSGLLDSPSKMMKIVRGMNYVSGDIPITVKLRTGSKDNNPVAHKLIRRMINETQVSAITLHGRTRQQRYTRDADWSYIAECSSLISNIKKQKGYEVDTFADDKELAEPQRQFPFFIGNGDCYSHDDYFHDLEVGGTDGVMVGRGALIKPWIFEEIKSGQYLDKSATERLSYVEQFAKHGLEYWGSDEMGVNTTRRFLCEFLSFTYRYVPIGLLERLPPRIQDRPPRWRGRNDLETLLGSGDAADWVKISEMFLGKTSDNFNFVPKHKSNSYDNIEAEG